MLRSLIRILAGFLSACLVAGATQVLFVVEAGKIFAARETAAATAILIAMAATQTAIFAAPFALIGIGLSETLSWRRLVPYLAIGVLIGLSGYATAIAGEGPGPTLMNDFAFWAFAVSGLAAGAVYWLIAGRWASAQRETRTSAAS